jgi:thiaminase/transcriptional activator TenA
MISIEKSVKRSKQYDAWIDMYGGDEFETAVKSYITLVDEACKTADETVLKEMQEYFLMSCKLEHMFWDQASTMMKWPEIGAAM